MAIGFIAFSAFKLFRISIRNTITRVIMVAVTVLTFSLFKTPWIFPAMLVSAGIATNFSDRRYPDQNEPRKKYKMGQHHYFLFHLFYRQLFLAKRRENKTGKTADRTTCLKTFTGLEALFLVAATC